MHSKLNKKGDLINAEYFCSGAFILSYEHIHLDILHIYLVFIIYNFEYLLAGSAFVFRVVLMQVQNIS